MESHAIYFSEKKKKKRAWWLSRFTLVTLSFGCDQELDVQVETGAECRSSDVCIGTGAV